VLAGALSGTFPVYLLGVEIPSIGFGSVVRAVGVDVTPVGLGGIAAFRFLNRFTYGNFGDSNQFGLEV
jgi:hypothetical protein